MENRLSPVSVGVVKDLEILSLCEKKSYIVPTFYAKNDWPFETVDSPTRIDIEKFDNLLKLSFNFIDAKMGLLVGVNCPELLKPLNVVNTIKNGPYATKHLFGWAVNGPNNNSLKPNDMSFRTKIESCPHQSMIKYGIIK